jgi:2-dehydro-3-deoxygluconokinase
MHQLAVEDATVFERRIVSIGECMVEFSGSESRMYRRNFAGDTFNTAWYLRHLLNEDWMVQYFTNLGDDRQSLDMLEFMKGSGVDTSLVKSLAGQTCGLYVISLENGERSFSYWRSASAARHLADDADVLSSATVGADCVCISGITLAILPEHGRKTLLQTMDNLRRSGTIVAFDSNIRKRLWTSDDEIRHWIGQAYQVASVALPTWSDEAEIFGDEDVPAAARRLSAAGVEEIVVKDGGNACFVQTALISQYVLPVDNVNVVDTTGAGDSFNAGYLASRLQGLDTANSVRKAHQIAGKVIGGYGALVSIKNAHL